MTALGPLVERVSALFDRVPGRIRLLAVVVLVVVLAVVATASAGHKKAPLSQAAPTSWFSTPTPPTWQPYHVTSAPTGYTLEQAWSIEDANHTTAHPIVAVFAVPAPLPGGTAAAQLQAEQTKYATAHYIIHSITLVDGTPALRVVGASKAGAAAVMLSETFAVANSQLYLVQFQTAPSAYASEQPAVVQEIDHFHLAS